MKSLAVLISTLASIVACGDGQNPFATNASKSSGSGNASSSESTSFFVDSEELLPPCTKERQGNLAYIVSTKSFKNCANGSWTVVELNPTTSSIAGKDGAVGQDGAKGADGKSSLVKVSDEVVGQNCATGGKKLETGVDSDGNGVLSSLEVSETSFVCNGADPSSKPLIAERRDISQSSDHCTYYSMETCKLDRGTITKFVDGTILISVNWFSISVFSTTGDTDTDLNDKASMLWISPTEAKGVIAVSDNVARSSGSYRSVFLSYNRDSSSAYLYFDTNDNGSLDLFSDAHLETLTVGSAY